MKDKVHDKPCRQRRNTNRSVKKNPKNKNKNKNKQNKNKTKKVTEFKYLGQNTHLKDTTKEEIYARIKAAWSCFGKKRKYSKTDNSPFHFKKKKKKSNGPMCLANNDLWLSNMVSKIKKQMTNKLRTAQRAMERKMLDLKIQDKIPCSEIRKRTKIIDIIEYTLKQKWKWAGHIARMKDNRWTKRCTEWQPEREEIKGTTKQKMAR